MLGELPSLFSSEQRFDKRVGVKGLQIVKAFADADELDGQFHGLTDSDNHASLRRAVELGQDHARAANAFVKTSAWRIAFWPLVPSRTSSTSSGAPGMIRWITLLIFSARASGGSGCAGGRRCQRSEYRCRGPGALAGVVGNTGWVGPGSTSDDLAAGALAQIVKLIGGGGPERVAAPAQSIDPGP